MLDIFLSDPSQYNELEREKLLKKLLEVLLNSDEMVYEIGWDIPAIVLPYFESSSCDFDSTSLKMVTTAVTLMKIFKVLATNGNHKELFLKAIECLSLIQVEPLDKDDKRSQDVANRFFELKFNAAFELLTSSLTRVEAQYPARFLANASAAVVAFMVEQLDDLTLRSDIFILRRIFMFGRDYYPLPAHKDVPETEEPLQRKLLQRLISDMMALGMEKFSLKWSQRFYVELKRGVAFNKKLWFRNLPYFFDETTLQFDDIIYRLTQLAYSCDVDIDGLFEELVNETCKMAEEQGAEEAKHEDDAEEEEEEEEHEEEHEDEDYDEEPENPFDFTSAKTPDEIPLNTDGVLLLATSARFDNRTNPKTLLLTFAQLVKLTKRFLMDAERSASVGIQDSLLFWALWVSRKVTADEVQAVPTPEFLSYLHMLMYIAAMSPVVDIRQMAYSITARLLGLHTPQVRADYLVDTIENCPFASVRDASIRMLKDFVAPAPASASASSTSDSDEVVDDAIAAVSKLSLGSDKDKDAFKPPLKLNPGHLKTLERVSLAQIQEVKSSEDGLLSDDFASVLSWTNFLAVVETSPEHVKRVYAECEEMVKPTKAEKQKTVTPPKDESTTEKKGKEVTQKEEEKEEKEKEQGELETRKMLLKMSLSVLESKWKL